MKWLLIIVALFLVANRRYLVGDLVRTVKKLPTDFKDGKKAAEDPAAVAKEIDGSTTTTTTTKGDERP